MLRDFSSSSSSSSPSLEESSSPLLSLSVQHSVRPPRYPKILMKRVASPLYQKCKICFRSKPRERAKDFQPYWRNMRPPEENAMSTQQGPLRQFST